MVATGVVKGNRWTEGLGPPVRRVIPFAGLPESALFTVRLKETATKNEILWQRAGHP